MCVKPLHNNKRTLQLTKKHFLQHLRQLNHFFQLQQADICSLCSAVRIWHHGACYCKPLQTLLPSWALSSIGCLLSTLISKSYKPGGLTPSEGSNFLGKSEQPLRETIARKRHKWSPAHRRDLFSGIINFLRPISPLLKWLSEWRRCKSWRRRLAWLVNAFRGIQI